MNFRYLFIDMNSYFASVEQQLQPRLRGRPVAVAPVFTPSGSCIAASYEAKKFGIKTGTRVSDALLLCPDLQVVEARPKEYVIMHHKIVAAVESCFHVDSVLSIDEMVGRLCPSEQNELKATQLGMQIKEAIRKNAGNTMRCSIGIAPNRLLAKIAADMQKPDGLTIIQSHELPHRLFTLSLIDFPGIGRRMAVRFSSYGIYSVEDMFRCSEKDLEQIWQSILGRRWWYHIRGYDLAQEPTHRSTVGHSHVLPPQLRNEKDAYAVLLRLLHKAAARLRKIGYWTKHLYASVRYLNGERWDDDISFGAMQDTLSLVEVFVSLWKRKAIQGRPIKVSVTLSDLVPDHAATIPLFKSDRNRVNLGRAMDKLNSKFGTNAVHLAEMHHVQSAAPMRISFTNIPDIIDSKLQ